MLLKEQTSHKSFPPQRMAAAVKMRIYEKCIPTFDGFCFGQRLRHCNALKDQTKKKKKKDQINGHTRNQTGWRIW